MPKWKKAVKGSQGQAMVEFVLVLPLLFVLAALTVDLGNLVLTANRLSAAAREGARVATESAAPVPTTEESCAEANCANSTTTCCIAVLRTRVVLENSGIRDAAVTGNWDIETFNNVQYTFLRVTATANVNVFFGTQIQQLQGTSVAYGDET